MRFRIAIVIVLGVAALGVIGSIPAGGSDPQKLDCEVTASVSGVPDPDAGKETLKKLCSSFVNSPSSGRYPTPVLMMQSL